MPPPLFLIKNVQEYFHNMQISSSCELLIYLCFFANTRKLGLQNLRSVMHHIQAAVYEVVHQHHTWRELELPHLTTKASQNLSANLG